MIQPTKNPLHAAIAVASSLALTLSLSVAAQTGTTQSERPAKGSGPAADAAEHVAKTEQVIKQMMTDPQLKALLQKSKGVFVVPTYGRAGLVAGAQGGPGVLMAKSDGKWNGPVFYNFGGISVGAQAGVAVGKIAMLLMDDKAINAFMSRDNFSLNADAGFTIVEYSARTQVSAGKGNVILWTDTEGAFANASIGLTDFRYDQTETNAYYGKNVAPKEVLSGTVSSPKPKTLQQVLSAKQ